MDYHALSRPGDRGVEELAGNHGRGAVGKNDGDVVDVTLPMSLRLERMENSPKKVAIMYGPIVLAGQLAREGFTEEMPYSGNQKAYSNMPTPDVPVLVADGKPVDQWVK